MTTFAVKFLGCKVSQADAMSARQALLTGGHQEVAEADAEVHVINTCCITGEAEAKSRQAVRRSLRSAGQVYVGGCAVNLDRAQFAEIDPRVKPLPGTAEDVAAAVAGELGACADLDHDILARERITDRWRSAASMSASEYSRPKVSVSEPSAYSQPNASASEYSARTRGFVKVQDGCQCHCAYCIIPTVRGGPRSRPAGAVLQEVRERVAAGQPELVLTGISVGDYRDPDDGLELGELMIAAARVPGVRRVRLSSVEVIHVRDSLLRALASEPNVCPHLHVPLQSGDDGVLEAMGRHYTAGEYLEQIAALHAAVGGRGGVNVTTDVIVGFPTEDEAAFQRTLATIDAAGVTRVHAFSYSPRPGTVAEALGDRVSAEEKKRRSRELRGHSELRSRRHRTAKLGRREQVLIDKVADTQCSGYTADYTRCYLPAGTAARGSLVEVQCVELHADGIRCEAAYP